MEISEERMRSIDFHIESGDYFGTLATIMGLMADGLSSNDRGAQARSMTTLTELRDDLVYLQRIATIERKKSPIS